MQYWFLFSFRRFPGFKIVLIVMEAQLRDCWETRVFNRVKTVLLQPEGARMKSGPSEWFGISSAKRATDRLDDS